MITCPIPHCNSGASKIEPVYNGLIETRVGGFFDPTSCEEKETTNYYGTYICTNCNVLFVDPVRK